MNPDYKQKIFSFYEKHKRMPGYSEIMSLLSFKSKNSVYKLINKMVDEGLVEKDSKGRLIPGDHMDQIPLLGVVEAGFPTFIDSQSSDTLSLNDYLISKKSATYILEVKGDSMIDEGIKEGDLVIVERGGVPKDGDIVIAEIDGGWTMKYFKKKGNITYLKPANKKYAPLYPQYELIIAAIVKGVIRKY